ncbi:MAG: S-layer homology domain-containing protein, partial [Clostridia bacterium]|nr:S-layer homology domain-containing protein [Clostridia bacterium]
MRRILSVFVITCIIAVSVIFVPMSASAVNTEDGILSLLAELKIMSGDPDGNMRLDDYVSRAEFTKIAVASSSYKNGVATNLAISPFPDVTYQHWAAPYVRVGVTGGLVNGYPDATFKPDGTVLYEEAITIMLRVLGYTDADFGVAWPSGQIGLANSLDMMDGISCTAGELMNRRQVARLVYNSLKTKIKGQQSALISVFDT